MYNTILIQGTGIVNTAIVNHAVVMEPSLGTLVRRAMKARGYMEGKELARCIGKSPSFVSKIINDNMKVTPAPDVFAALERELGVSQERMLRAFGYAVGDRESRVGSAEVNDAKAEAVESVLAVVDSMDTETTLALAKAGYILLELRRPQTVAHPVLERVPTLR